MNRTLWVGASGMIAQQLNLDTIAHDLANVNTVGFKRGRAEFSELFASYQQAPGAPSADGNSPIGLYVGHGARPAAVRRDFSQGSLQHSGQPFDFAIEGEGFFAMELAGGRLGYTRNSSFQTDGQGRIVDNQGRLLEGDFNVPDDAEVVEVSSDGTISVTVDGVSQVVGQLLLSRFVNPQGLESLGGGLYGQTDASGDAVTATPGQEGLGRIRHGFVEQSNVSVVEEMVNMITAQRAYEMNARAVSVADEMLETLNQVLQ
ncbi:MAG: flagellar basal-body rod protein FlgG [Acidobacteriota bacterium]